MRRRTLMAGLAALLVAMLACGLLAGRAWLSHSDALVMGGASDVTIRRQGVARMHLTYRLPGGRTPRDLRVFLVRQGWRRIALPSSERSMLSFVRSGWPRAMREILVVTIDPQDSTFVDIQMAQCFVGRWANCF